MLSPLASRQNDLPRLLTRLALLLALACSSPAPVPVEPLPAPEADPRVLSAARAWAHLERLVEIGPRASGTPGGEAARQYIRGELESYGLAVEEQPIEVSLADGSAIEAVNLIATLPGSSEDLFVLVAPYDTRYFERFDFVGANDGGSGAALLLELARVLSQRTSAYTTRVAFVDAEAPLGRGAPEESNLAWIGSTHLAERWAESGELASIRLLVYMNRIGDADLRISRDLRSHRRWRQAFWRSAGRLGRSDAFPPVQDFESPTAGHLAFTSRGLRRAVLLTDTRYGSDEPPGLYAGTEDDTPEHCSQESLETVGLVVLDAVASIARELEKIDRFAAAPLEPLPARPAAAPAPRRASSPAQPAAVDPQPDGSGAAAPSTGPPEP